MWPGCGRAQKLEGSSLALKGGSRGQPQSGPLSPAETQPPGLLLAPSGPWCRVSLLAAWMDLTQVASVPQGLAERSLATSGLTSELFSSLTTTVALCQFPAAPPFVSFGSQESEWSPLTSCVPRASQIKLALWTDPA